MKGPAPTVDAGRGEQPQAAAADAYGGTVSAPVAQKAEAKPPEPEQSATIGRVRRVGGISIKPTEPVAPVTVAAMVGAEQQKDLPPLTTEMLEPCWEKALQQLRTARPRLADTLAGREVRIDGEDHFLIVVNNSYTESEIKPHLVGLLSMLRREMNRPQLNCSIEVEWEEKEAVIYTPRDKYDALSAKNPALGMFKVLFPEVDY